MEGECEMCTQTGSIRPGHVFVWLLALLFAGAAVPRAASAAEPPKSTARRALDWWSENFEVHGFLTSKAYFRTPNFARQIETSSWRTELNIEPELRLYEGDDFRLALYGVFRPIFEGVYEIQSDLWGGEVERAEFGTAPAYPDDPVAYNQWPIPLGGGAGALPTFAERSGQGRELPCSAAGLSADCAGGQVEGEFTIINADTGSYFTGELVPAVSIDNVVFFGRVTAPVRPRGAGQDEVGGNADGEVFEDLRDHFGDLVAGFRQGEPFYGALHNAGMAGGTGLDASLSAASLPLSTPLNSYQGAFGDAESFDYGSTDMNRREDELKWECFDNAHPWCIVREFYLEAEYKNTFMRLGRQQIVWGKTDAFRLQDRINPIDLGYHSIFPDLEERRIPQLALDLVQSFGDVGPFQDVSLEFAWVFDRFLPDQFGQCGEPYAFTAACGARANASAHKLFNFSLAAVDEVEWKIENTEPGLRLEFRLPDPSISFSLSTFYTHQDQPVARFVNHYSTSNPNPATMLFLQGLYNTKVDLVGHPFGGTPVANLIEIFSGNAPGSTVWSTGFDPYSHDASGNPTGTLALANGILQVAWGGVFATPPAGGGCAGLSGDLLAACAGSVAIFALPWSTSTAILEYPRVWVLGGSLDYQIPRVDTVLRLEMAADFDRDIQDTSRLDGISESAVFQAAIGLDWSTFIPFLNRNRTAFITAQTFFEHIVDYREGASGGMVPYEASIISTLLMQNYWRNDSIVLSNLVAVDWKADAVIWGPKLRWVFNDHISFDIGMNWIWGATRKHNIRDVCADATLSCLSDPTSWQEGNWQMINAALARTSEQPWWGQQSFGDKFMRNRDEFWVGVTYQF